jgi:hypothetical protein
MYKSYFTLLLLALLFSSCGLIHFEPTINGLYSRYDKTNEAYPGLLVKTDTTTTVCNLQYTEEPKVYVVNGLQLKECLSNHDDAIVYIWDAHCTSKECYSPSLLQKYCDKKNVELYVVTEYYDGADLVQFYEINRPIFGIDTKYYKADFIEKYVARFEADLNAEDKETGRMLYFKKGEYRGKAKLEFEN